LIYLLLASLLLAQDGDPTANRKPDESKAMLISTSNLGNVRYVMPSDNWRQSGFSTTGCSPACTVTLPAGISGIDVSNRSMYYVRIVEGKKSEIQLVTGGTYTAARGGTIQFTPKAIYTQALIGSASSGIQEAINEACGPPGSVYAANANAHIILPPTGAASGALPVYGTIFAHCSHSLIDGSGTLLSCSTRDRCMFMGDRLSSNHYGGLTVRGIAFTSTVAADGCQIASTQRMSNVVIITTASTCSTIRTGDTVNINFTDSLTYWGNHGPVTVSGTTITYPQTGADIAQASTPGTIAIENAAIEDNAMPGNIEDIKSSYVGGNAKFNQFIVEDDDEAATIRNLDADGSQSLTCDANHCGSYVYAVNSGAPVIWVDKANISPQCGGNGITALANNTTKITDSVIQGWAMWAENTQTLLGGYGGTTSENVYMEEGSGPCYHPYNPRDSGTVFSAAGIMWQGGPALNIQGGEQPGGHLPLFANTGTTQYNYYVIANDETTRVHSFPLFAGYALTNGSGTISGQFPRVPPQHAGDTVTYDILRMVPSATAAANKPDFPVKGLCSGGSMAVCGSIITKQAQCSGLVCRFTDTASASTASYTIPNTTWSVQLPFWPATILVNGNGGWGGPSPILADVEMNDVVDAANGLAYPRVYVRQCNYSDATSLGSDLAGVSGGAWKNCTSFGTNGTGTYGATVIENNGLAGVQGRLNFINTSPYGFFGVNAGHIITLVNSIPTSTLATAGFRPPASVNDTWIGLDVGGAYASAGLAFGAPISISNYIGTKGDNSSYLERLTATAKTFTVPVTTNRQIISRLPDGAPPFDVLSQTRVPNLTTGGNPVLKSCGTSTTCANRVLLNGTVVIGSVALNSGTATVTDLPFSNTSFICTTSDTTTETNRSKMVEASSTSAVVTGSGGDKIAYICGGN